LLPASLQRVERRLLEVFREDDPRIAFDALVARILRGNAGLGGRVAHGLARLGHDVGLLLLRLSQRHQPLARGPINPGGRAFLAELLIEPDRLFGLAGAAQCSGLVEPLLAVGQRCRHDANGFVFGHVRRDLGQHRRVRVGEDAVSLGGALAEEAASHVALGVEGVAAFAPARRVDVGDRDAVGLFRSGDHLALRGDDHRPAAPHGDDEVDEVLHGAGAEGRETDVVVADGGPA